MRPCIVLVAVAWVLCSCATFSPEESAALADLRSSSSIALLPVRLPDSLELRETVRAQIEADLERYLATSGYDVLPSIAFRDIVNQMLAAVGAEPDSELDELAAERADAVAEHAYREMILRHPAELFLSPELVVVEIPVQQNFATWDGVLAKLPSLNSGFGDTLSPYTGQVQALSLRVVVFDRRRQPRYGARAGIELIQIRNGHTLQPIAADQILRDPESWNSALQRALSPLAKED